MTQRSETGRSGDMPPLYRRRLRVIVAGWILLALACGLRAGQLQLTEAEQWREIARDQNRARTEIPATRGGIHDRSGEPLALASHEFRGYLAPSETRSPAEAASAVARVLGLGPSQERRLRSRDAGWVALPRRVSAEERDRLQAAVRRGLHFERLSSRVFPQGPLARPLLGSIDGDGRGSSGLELALDSLLRGEPGAALARKDARGRTYRLPDAQLSAPRPGRDVRLTLDADLQRIAEDALERALRETGASGGDVLMLDPQTGEILAVASRRAGDRGVLAAFTSPYEPGSTLKPFLLASLLAEGRVELDERIDTEGGTLRRHGRVIRDVHPRDTLTASEVVRHSSNVGAIKLAGRLEPGLQYSFLRDFGFGTPTGIGFPAESGGMLRRPERWSALSQASLAMGYEISVTSLQLAAAYGALANDGVLMRPYLVREVRNADGEVVHRRRPEPMRRVVRREVADAVDAVLSRVVDGGTGSRAALATLPVAGKTGTARVAAGGRYEDGRYGASFVGYTPVGDPSLVVLTKLNDPQGDYYGGLTAAPISRSTLQAALATRGVELPVARPAPGGAEVSWGGAGEVPRDDGPFVFAVSGSAPTAAAEGTGVGTEPEARVRTLPDLRGLSLRTAVGRLHELGLRPRVEADGPVAGQDPAPGTRLEVGSRVVLR